MNYVCRFFGHDFTVSGWFTYVRFSEWGRTPLGKRCGRCGHVELVENKFAKLSQRFTELSDAFDRVSEEFEKI